MPTRCSLCAGSTTWSWRDVISSTGIVSSPYRSAIGANPSTWNDNSGRSGGPSRRTRRRRGRRCRRRSRASPRCPPRSSPAIISTTSGVCGCVAALMQTMPAVSGCWRAAHSVSDPPMLNPATMIVSARPARRRYAASTSAVQSAQPVVEHLLDDVPWPGSRGSSTCRPSAARRRRCPHRRRVAGEAVQHERAGAGPSVGSRLVDQASAPGRTAVQSWPTFYPTGVEMPGGVGVAGDLTRRSSPGTRPMSVATHGPGASRRRSTIVTTPSTAGSASSSSSTAPPSCSPPAATRRRASTSAGVPGGQGPLLLVLRPRRRCSASWCG